MFQYLSDYYISHHEILLDGAKKSTALYKFCLENFPQPLVMSKCKSILKRFHSKNYQEEFNTFLTLEKKMPSTKDFNDSYSFFIPKSSIIIDNKMNKNWTANLYKHFGMSNLQCTPKVKSKVIKSYSPFKMKAYCVCKADNCRNYTLNLQEHDEQLLDGFIFTFGELNTKSHSTQTIRQPIMGSDRAEMMKSVLAQTATNIVDDITLKSNLLRQEYGNFDYIPKLPTIRKIRQEFHKLGDLDDDDIIAIRELKKLLSKSKVTDIDRTPQYIQHIIEPFGVMFFCNSQLKILSKLKGIEGFFDATGSIVRKSKIFSH